MKFDVPSPDAPLNDGGSFERVWVTFFDHIRNVCVFRSQSGTTARRPTTGLEVGLTYYDTTLNKPIWLKTVATKVWVDATGTTV